MDSHDKPTSDHDDEGHLEAPKLQSEDTLGYVPDTEEERKLVRKIDLFLLPAIWGMYLLSYMVRTMLVINHPSKHPAILTSDNYDPAWVTPR